jgi:hypothetical protein
MMSASQPTHQTSTAPAAPTRLPLHVLYPLITHHNRHLVEKLNKKSKNNNVKPFMVKNHLWVFINAQIENPAFDSQVGLRISRFELLGQLQGTLTHKAPGCSVKLRPNYHVHAAAP